MCIRDSLSGFISEEEYAAIYPQVEAAHNQLEAKSGPGNDFLGWMYLPRDTMPVGIRHTRKIMARNGSSTGWMARMAPAARCV